MPRSGFRRKLLMRKLTCHWTNRCSARATRRGSAGSTLIVPAVMVIASISVRGKEKGGGQGERLGARRKGGVFALIVILCCKIECLGREK